MPQSRERKRAYMREYMRLRREELTKERPEKGLTYSAVSPFPMEGVSLDKVTRRKRKVSGRGFMPYIIPGRMQISTSEEQRLRSENAQLRNKIEALERILESALKQVREPEAEYRTA
jgi:hypothetical protein